MNVFIISVLVCLIMLNTYHQWCCETYLQSRRKKTWNMMNRDHQSWYFILIITQQFLLETIHPRTEETMDTKWPTFVSDEYCPQHPQMLWRHGLPSTMHGVFFLKISSTNIEKINAFKLPLIFDLFDITVYYIA